MVLVVGLRVRVIIIEDVLPIFFNPCLDSLVAAEARKTPCVISLLYRTPNEIHLELQMLQCNPSLEGKINYHVVRVVGW